MITTGALNQNWLGTTTNGYDDQYGGRGLVSSSYSYWYPVYTSVERPIKLTLSEVERLRKAARADEKLKAILQKFTSQIEITVDFE